MAEATRPVRRWFQFRLRTLLLLFIPVALLAAFAARVLFPPAIEVDIYPEQVSLCRYDDLAGNDPMSAAIKIVNTSTSTVWYQGGPGSPATDLQQCVEGEWNYLVSWSSSPGKELPWTPLHSMESITVFAGPIEEKATEMRFGVPLTTEWFRPRARWVYSRVSRVVKKGSDSYLEVKEGSQQQVLIRPARPDELK